MFLRVPIVLITNIAVYCLFSFKAQKNKTKKKTHGNRNKCFFSMYTLLSNIKRYFRDRHRHNLFIKMFIKEY